jgi:hypothetical protein
MKNSTPLHPLPCLAFLLGLAVSVPAQNYSLQPWTVASGGGTSTGLVSSLSGTVGQHDAGICGGNSFVLQGGFWGMVAAV